MKRRAAALAEDGEDRRFCFAMESGPLGRAGKSSTAAIAQGRGDPTQAMAAVDDFRRGQEGRFPSGSKIAGLRHPPPRLRPFASLQVEVRAAHPVRRP